MADFVAVLRKTIDGLGETTPEMRAKVYDKARATVDAKLAAISPPPPPSVAARQKKTLEDAIEKIEADFARVKRPAPTSDPLAELENVFAALKAKPSLTPAKPAAPAAPPPSEAKTPTPPAPRPDAGPAQPEPVRAASPAPEEEFDEGAVALSDADDPYAGADPDSVFEREPPRRKSFAGLIVALIALLVLGGGGYAVWLNKDDFGRMLGIGGRQVARTETAAPVKPASPAKSGTAKPDAAKPGAADSGVEPPKFTQRLNADGTETDEGPAGGAPGIGEGTSVASATQPSQNPDETPDSPQQATDNSGAGSTAGMTSGGAAPTAEAQGNGLATAQNASETTTTTEESPTATTPAAESSAPAATAPSDAGQAIAVGQKAIYYEERTSSSAGSADAGSVVWSLVQESPGGDLPPEPAIRGEATIPGKDLQLRMTIKRNADKSLPASHIIELIFLTPDNFAGGGIDNILRFAMKDTEEAAGSPLIGIPAKIADGFFLVALNDSKAEIEANMTLMRRQDWIDVPVIYKSGRRALITMEKGIPGEKVFDEAMKAWESARAG